MFSWQWFCNTSLAHIGMSSITLFYHLKRTALDCRTCLSGPPDTLTVWRCPLTHPSCPPEAQHVSTDLPTLHAETQFSSLTLLDISFSFTKDSHFAPCTGVRHHVWEELSCTYTSCQNYRVKISTKWPLSCKFDSLSNNEIIVLKLSVLG